MWNRPWNHKEGMAIGGGLVATGLMLQLSVGLIDWGLTAWPVNGWLAALFVAALVAMHCLRHRVYLFQWLSSMASAVSALTTAVAVTMVLGLITQAPVSNTEAAWIHRLLSSWPFVLVYVWLTVSLGLTILRVFASCFSSKNNSQFSIFNSQLIRRLPFFLNHLGLFIALVAATLGNADMQRLNMTVGKESMGYGPQAIAYDELSPQHEVQEMDFALVLKDFEIEYYLPDSLKPETFTFHPKCYTSYVSVFVKDGDEARHWGDTIVQVNHPVTVNGWKIYQYSYDDANGVHTRYSTFQLVRDPWLPAVYVGIYMLLAGAVLMIVQSVVQRGRKGRGSKITVAALLLFFGITAYVFIPIMTNKQLMPALQSPWFAPHVLVYMFAYTLMGAAALIAIWELIRIWKLSIVNYQLSIIIDALVHIGNALIAIGMLFGALWAKEAWGHYWSWDPKETWAAATWFAYLIYIHYRLAHPKSILPTLLMTIICFLLLQMCWWGINYLPSAQATSVHTYNM